MVKILQLTDLHILPKADDTLLGVETEKYFKQVLEQAHRTHGNFDLFLLTGDLAQDPCPDSYRRIREILSDYQTPCLCLPGNHDDIVLMRRIFDHAPVTCGRHKQLANWQIICLNSQKADTPVGLLAQSELVFLSEQLQRHPELYTVIAVHHHCITSDSSWMDRMIIENSDELFARIVSHPHVKAIVCGHIHQVLEKTRNSVMLLGTPATCFQFKPGCHEFALDDKPPGYRVLQLNDDGTLHTNVEWIPVRLDELDFDSSGY